MSLPKSLSFPNVRSNAVASVSSVYTCTPTNSSALYLPSTILSFDIPCGIRSQWLDPSQTYLRFSVAANLTGTGSPQWQAQAYDFIQGVSLYSSAGSKNIEQVSNYNNVHCQLRDLYSSLDNKTSDSIMLNLGSSGLRTSAPIASGAFYTYALPLASIIGLQSADSVMLPTHALSSALRIEITLASANAALTCTGAPTAVNYQISSPVLSVGLITISDVAQAQITHMTGGVYNWSSVIYRSFRNVHAAQQASDSILIPARFSSLRSIMVSQRESANLENSAAYLSDRIKNQLVSYQFKVGSSYATQRPVDCTNNAIDAWMQLRACLGSALSGEHLPTLLSKSDWMQQTSTLAGAGEPGSFLITQSLEPFSNQNALLSGTNTAGSQIMLELNYDPQQTANIKATTLDAVVCADCLLTIANGELNISF